MEISQVRTVTTKSLLTALKVCAKVKRPAFVTGQPGCGKSDVISQLCTEMGGKLFDVRLGQLSAGDLRGIPYFDKETGVMKYAPPVDLPSAKESAEYPVVVLFLDEMNSAAPAVMGEAYQLILNRRVGEYRVPDNCIIFAAGNRDGDKGIVYKMPTPLANRFVHLEVKVDFDSWFDWAIVNKIHPDVVGFLSHSKSSLSDFDPKSPSKAFATPRTWEFVSQLLGDDDIDEATATDLFAGTIGEGLALKFLAYRKHTSKLPDPLKILDGTIKELNTKEISVMYSLVTELNYALKDMWDKVGKTKDEDKWHAAADNMLGFALKNFSIEIQVMGFRTAMQKFNLPFTPKKLTNFKEYYDKVGKLLIKAVS